PRRPAPAIAGTTVVSEPALPIRRPWVFLARPRKQGGQLLAHEATPVNTNRRGKVRRIGKNKKIEQKKTERNTKIPKSKGTKRMDSFFRPFVFSCSSSFNLAASAWVGRRASGNANEEQFGRPVLCN